MRRPSTASSTTHPSSARRRPSSRVSRLGWAACARQAAPTGPAEWCLSAVVAVLNGLCLPTRSACPPAAVPCPTLPRPSSLPPPPPSSLVPGKISRVLAAKCALGVRVDALGEVSDEGAVGLEARAKVGAVEYIGGVGWLGCSVAAVAARGAPGHGGAWGVCPYAPCCPALHACPARRTAAACVHHTSPSLAELGALPLGAASFERGPEQRVPNLRGRVEETTCTEPSNWHPHSPPSCTHSEPAFIHSRAALSSLAVRATCPVCHPLCPPALPRSTPTPPHPLPASTGGGAPAAAGGQAGWRRGGQAARAAWSGEVRRWAGHRWVLALLDCAAVVTGLLRGAVL